MSDFRKYLILKYEDQSKVDLASYLLTFLVNFKRKTIKILKKKKRNQHGLAMLKKIKLKKEAFMHVVF